MNERLILKEIQVPPSSLAGVMNSLLRFLTARTDKLRPGGKPDLEVDSSSFGVELNILDLRPRAAVKSDSEFKQQPSSRN